MVPMMLSLSRAAWRRSGLVRPHARPRRATLCSHSKRPPSLGASDAQRKGEPPVKSMPTTRLVDRVKLVLWPYRIGCRRLWNNIKFAAGLLYDGILTDHRLTRRERRILLRTVFDISKLLPFAILAALPGGSVLLPVLGKLMPSTLPTTFNMPSQTTLEKAYKLNETEKSIQVDMDRQLKAGVKNIVSTMQKQQVAVNRDLQRVLDRVAKDPTTLDPTVSEKHAKLLYSNFSDEDLLDMLNLHQLERLSQHLNRQKAYIEQYASDHYRFSILRYQLSKHMQKLSSEDAIFVEEGPGSLPDQELLYACLDRGLVHNDQDGNLVESPVPSRQTLQRRLERWLLLTVANGVPPVLLVFGDLQNHDAVL